MSVITFVLLALLLYRLINNLKKFQFTEEFPLLIAFYPFDHARQVDR